MPVKDEKNTSFNIQETITVNASVGGYGGTSYQVEIDLENGTAEYTVFDYGYEHRSTESIDLSPDEINHFLAKLEEANVFRWKKEYVNRDILDGTSWSVELTLRGGNVFESRGSNAYPKRWELFCRSLQSLLGREFG